MNYKKQLTKEHSETVLRKMFDVVGADYDSFDFDKDYWYHSYEWTEEQQNKYIEWLAEFLKKHNYAPKKGRRYSYSGKSKPLAEHEAYKIVVNYGWRTIKNKKQKEK